MSPIVLALIVLLAGICTAVPDGGRIVGGDEVRIEDYPSMVQMESFRNNNWGHICAGNILNEQFILSAAHCTTRWFDLQYRVENRRIRAGTTNRGSGGVVHNAAAIINHHSFNPLFNALDGDICIIRLETLLTLNDAVRIGPIAPLNYEVPDDVGVVHAGWGLTQHEGSPSPVLLHININTVNNDVCRERFENPPDPRYRGTVTRNMICAGVLDVGGKGACQGDSGGPLYYGGVLIGVISWGGVCADAYLPAVSARVSSYTDWIVANAS